MFHKKALAILLLVIPALASAAPPDISEGAWYSSTVNAFVDAEYFQNDIAFRAGDNATRAEFIELIVKLQGGVTKSVSGQSFDDVSLNASYYNFFEQAGQSGFMKGVGSCYGTHPCMAKPESPINRAEAAAIIQRAFAIHLQGDVPSFKDNPDGQWFTDGIRIAASNCILQGDAGSSKVRPSDNMNRAEMVVMLDRLKRNLIYPNCTAEGQSYVLPKAPRNDPQASSSPSSSTSSSISSSTEDLLNPKNAWICGEWSICDNTGTQYRKCYRNPLITALYNLKELDAPQSFQHCTLDQIAWMKNKLDEWDKVHEQMLEKAKGLAQQQNGNACGRTLTDIENRFVMRLNEYIAVYNDNSRNRFESSLPLIQLIEDSVNKIIDEFKAAPTVCF
jgi:hypothetical protein